MCRWATCRPRLAGCRRSLTPASRWDGTQPRCLLPSPGARISPPSSSRAHPPPATLSAGSLVFWQAHGLSIGPHVPGPLPACLLALGRLQADGSGGAGGLARLAAIDCDMAFSSDSVRMVVQGRGPLGKFTATVSGLSITGGCTAARAAQRPGRTRCTPGPALPRVRGEPGSCSSQARVCPDGRQACPFSRGAAATAPARMQAACGSRRCWASACCCGRSSSRRPSV
jgi:hypothetical protein